MRLFVFAVFDAGANAFLQPFFMRSKGEAMRSFVDAVGDDKSPFCKHPSDYTCMLLGEFDDASGGLIGGKAPEKVLTALEARDMAKSGVPF